MGWAFQLLGSFEVLYDGEPVKGPRGLSARTLLAYLLLHPAKEAPTRHGLACDLWPDEPVELARERLDTLVEEVCAALPSADSLLQVDPLRVGIKSDADVQTDVARFFALVERLDARDGDAQAELEEAQRLYAGPLLPGWCEPWVVPLRERLAQHAEEVSEDLARVHEKNGELLDAVAVTELARSRLPGVEAIHRRMIRLLSAADHRAEALLAYHACVHALEAQGRGPAAATEELAARLRFVSLGREAGAPRSPRFVGRRDELETIAAAAEVMRGEGAVRRRVLVLRGAPGIGKSRLGGQALRAAKRAGARVAVARGQPGHQRQPLEPTTQWLSSDALAPLVATADDHGAAALAALHPELRARHSQLPQSSPSHLSPTEQPARFHEAIAGVLEASERPLVLFLDDAAEIDAGTVACLQHVLQGGHTPLLLLLALGEAPCAELTPLREVLQQRGAWHELTLGPLSAAESAELVAEHGGDRERQQWALSRGAGHPLHLLELLRSRSPRGYISERLESVIAGRLEQLDYEERAVAEVVAVAGHALSWDAMAAASGMSQQVVTDAINQLWGLQLLRQTRPGAYAFEHELIRQVLEESLPEGRRDRLKQRVAEVLG